MSFALSHQIWWFVLDSPRTLIQRGCWFNGFIKWQLPEWHRDSFFSFSELPLYSWIGGNFKQFYQHAPSLLWRALLWSFLQRKFLCPHLRHAPSGGGQHLLGDGLPLSPVHCCLLSPRLSPHAPPELLGSTKLFAPKLPLPLLLANLQLPGHSLSTGLWALIQSIARVLTSLGGQGRVPNSECTSFLNVWNHSSARMKLTIWKAAGSGA